MSFPYKFGKYYLLERINVGGMAEVFKAKSFGVEGFEKLIAIKRILPAVAEDEDFIKMFIDEAKISVQLNHSNIAQIFDLGRIDDSYFIALEFIHGKDLRTIWERHNKRGLRLPIPMSAYIMARVCEGLDYAHRKKDSLGRELHIVHRDVSPQNILISYDGEVKIIDFGIAKAANKISKTQAGILKGKFGYMSPEQVRGLTLDRRADVFAAGIILYELVTGERLFVGESDFSILEKIRNVQILPPSTYNQAVPDQLEKIILRALTKDPADRFPSAYELQEELQRFLIAHNTNFARKDLATYLKRAFKTDIERELDRNKKYEALTERDVTQDTSAASLDSTESDEQHLFEEVPAGPDHASTARVGLSEVDEIATMVYDTRSGLPTDAPTRPAPPGYQEEAAAESGQEPGDGRGPLTAPPRNPARRPAGPGAKVPPRGAPKGPVEPASLAEPRAAALPPPPPLLEEVMAAAPESESASSSDLATEEFPSDQTNTSQEATPGRRRARLNTVIIVLAAVAVGVFGFAVFKYLRQLGLLGGKASIQVLVTPPSAQLLLDGQPVANPIRNVPPGTHLLEARADSYQPYRQEIQARGDADLSVEITMQFVPASLVLHLRPEDATLKMDGELKEGHGTFRLNDILPGEHTFLVERDAYEPQSQVYKFAPRQVLEKTIALQPRLFMVDVRSTPIGATVLLDGVLQKGQTPLQIPKLKANQNYQLTLKRAGYTPWQATVNYDGKATREINVRLESSGR